MFAARSASAHVLDVPKTRPGLVGVYSHALDFALAWTPLPNFQLDVGINIGLVPEAIPYQIYAGIAQRF